MVIYLLGNENAHINDWNNMCMHTYLGNKVFKPL